MQNTATFRSPDDVAQEINMTDSEGPGVTSQAAAGMGIFVNEQTKQQNRSDLSNQRSLYGNKSNLQDVAYMKWLRTHNRQKLKITSHKEMVSAHSIGEHSIRKGSARSKGFGTNKTSSSYDEQ